SNRRPARTAVVCVADARNLAGALAMPPCPRRMAERPRTAITASANVTRRISPSVVRSVRLQTDRREYIVLFAQSNGAIGDGGDDEHSMGTLDHMGRS